MLAGRLLTLNGIEDWHDLVGYIPHAWNSPWNKDALVWGLSAGGFLQGSENKLLAPVLGEAAPYSRVVCFYCVLT